MIGWIAITIVLLASILVLMFWRAADRKKDESAWGELLLYSDPDPQLFELSMVSDLPEPARKYFAFTIESGAPLWSIAKIDMIGKLGLGSKADPNFKPMKASELLAPPHGFVWKVKAGCVIGSDGATPRTSWTRFWLFGLIPIVRIQDDPNHHRSAFGRIVSEAAFWVPSSLLPGPYIDWEPIDSNRARAIVTYQGYRQTI